MELVNSSLESVSKFLGVLDSNETNSVVKRLSEDDLSKFKKEFFHELYDLIPNGYECKYLDSNDVLLFALLINNAKNNGATTLVLSDGENKSNYDVCAPDCLLNVLCEIDGGCEEYGFNFFDKNNKRLGWFGYLGLSGFMEKIFDYSDNDFCNKVLSNIDVIEELTYSLFESEFDCGEILSRELFKIKLQENNGKLVFHSYEALKKYCDKPENPLDVVVLGKEIDSLSRLFDYSDRTNEQFKGIADWNVSNVTDMHRMFNGAYNFNQPLNNWDVSKVWNMSGMFYRASTFNQPLNNWDVSNVEDMSDMFLDASTFNQPLDNWNVSNVTDMAFMFSDTERFNQPLDKWTVSKVEDMGSMFRSAKTFNQPLNNWDVSKVENMTGMFRGAKNFNQPLDKWDLSNKPYGAKDLEKFRQSKGQVVEQKESKKKAFHR